MSLVQNYLKTHSLSELQKEYNIHIGYHETLPLVVLNYHAIKSKKFDPLVEECRGLVLELATNNIIAIGMSRFYDYNGINYDFHKGMRCENKEDGTLLHLFYYESFNSWILSNRYNFCEDIVNQSKYNDTYENLFEEICGASISELCKSLNKNTTYCLEMCSLANAIIKLYQTSKIFLLCAYDNKTLQEIPYDQIEILTCWERPEYFIADSLKEILDKVDNNPDITFEGYVLVNKFNKRIKIKSKSYKMIHALKYRGWPAMTYDTATYLVNNSMVDQVLGVLSYYRNQHDIEEMQYRIKMFLTHGKKYKFIDTEHPKKYCELLTLPDKNNYVDSGMTKIPPIKKTGINEDYFDSWIVTCYCGQPMPLRRLKYDFTIYKICHCGAKFDIKVYNTDTYLYICDTCNLTHEAYQYTRTLNSNEILPCYQPTGMPASEQCKNIRLHVHQLINILIKEHNYDKNQVYELMSVLMSKKRSEMHIGKLDIMSCNELIIKLQDYVKKIKKD